MLKRDSGDMPDGGRAILFTTPCGYEIAAIRTAAGKLKILAHNMFGEYVADFLVNHQHLISADGARELAGHLGMLYGKPE